MTKDAELNLCLKFSELTYIINYISQRNNREEMTRGQESLYKLLCEFTDTLQSR